MRITQFVIAVLAAGLLPSGAALACASCGCTLSPDWDNLNLSDHAGWRAEIRYDALDQNDLRTGASRIAATTASTLTHEGDPYEIEKYTRNHYVTAGFDYGSGQGFGLNIQIPWVGRDHETLGTASDGIHGGTDGGQYRSSTRNLGDIKVVGRYQGLGGGHNLGLLFGLKLPTGRTGLTGLSTDTANPGRVGIDRGLQPGTGTTDLILGAYYAAPLSRDWDVFAQGLYQHALSAHDGYRPGDGTNLNLGLRYMGLEGIRPQVQLNARYVRYDQGFNADSVSTGGTLVYLSPGVSVSLSKTTELFGYVQLPVYQDVRGIQLTTRGTVSVGLRTRF